MAAQWIASGWVQEVKPTAAPTGPPNAQPNAADSAVLGVKLTRPRLSVDRGDVPTTALSRTSIASCHMVSSMRGMVTFVCAVLLLTACSNAAQTPLPVPTPSWSMPTVAAPKVLTVIGDSYTYGTPFGGLGSYGWPALTFAQLRKNGIEAGAKVAAEGSAGYSTPGLQGHTFGQLAANAVQPHDDLVVYFGSLNDGSDGGLDAQRTTVSVHETFAKTRTTAPAAKILVIGPAWPAANVPPHASALRDILSREASQVGAAFVDPLGERWLQDDPTLIGPDHIHPNDAGHRYLADKIEPLIEAQLR